MVRALPRRSPDWWAIRLGLALFTIACLSLLVALILWLSDIGPDLAGGKRGVVSAIEEPPAAGQVSTHRSRPPARPAGNTSDAPAAAALTFRSRPPQFFKAPAIGECWRSARQRMLLLESDRGGGIRFPGIIVDSRGWVLTSLSAVAGSSRLVARISPMTIHDFASARDTAASITEYVAADPARDLVLLQVDRRMVEVIGPARLAERTPVAGTWLIGVGPVAEGFSPWIVETRLADAGSASVRVVDGSDREWFLHDQPAGNLSPGLALFSIGGELVGVNTAVRDDRGFHRAVSVEFLGPWLAEVSRGPERLRPLAGLKASDAAVQIGPAELPDVRPASGGGGIKTYPPPKLVGGEELPNGTGTAPPVPEPAATQSPAPAAGTASAESAGPAPSREAVIARLEAELSRTASACEEFGFVPKDDLQLQAMLPFVRVMNEVQTMLAIPEGEIDALARRDWNRLDRAQTRVLDRALEAIRKEGHFAWQKESELAIAARQPGAETVLFATSMLGANGSPLMNGQPSTLFRIEQTDHSLIAITDPEGRTYRPNTRWLLFGRWLDEPDMKVRTDAYGTVMAHQFELLVSIGPFK